MGMNVSLRRGVALAIRAGMEAASADILLIIAIGLEGFHSMLGGTPRQSPSLL
jgi:hypothetical protein